MSRNWRGITALLVLGIGVLGPGAPGGRAARANGIETSNFWFGGNQSCEIEKVNSITPTFANLGTYTPPNAAPAVAIDVTISLKTKGSGTCKGALTFYRPQLPARMTRAGGSGTRGYAIRTGPGGGTDLIFASWPPYGRTLDFNVQSSSHSQTVTLTVYVAAEAGWMAAGNYSDSILMKVLDRKGNGYEIVRYQNFTVASLVQNACVLPPPSIANLNFTNSIANGLPNGAAITVTFAGVSCSAPARIRLSGEALKNPAIAPAAGFDNFINWEAKAIFGHANVVLNTSAASQATSSAQNVGSGPTSNAVITLSVKLLAGNRVIAGHYSNVLTVTVDPVL
jgi:hypothetical protein